MRRVRPGPLGILVEDLYSRKDRPAEEWADSHIEALVLIAAGYQHREHGIAEHLRRVAAFAGLLATAMGWDEKGVMLLEHASVFHDVGMMEVPEAIVNKHGPLTEEQVAIVRRHAETGHEILSASGIALLEEASLLAWCHHERHDGSGYPRGLAGKDIPAGARILTLVDVFDALTSSKPFKEAYPFEVAYEIVHAMSGSHFDPEVVDALTRRCQEFADAHARLSSQGTLARKGFRISARDRSRREVYSGAQDGYFSCPFCRNLHPRALNSCPQFEYPLSDIHKLSGTVLDEKYKLLGALGVGGMGTVYEARHLIIDRPLAIKLLDPALATDAESLTRFQNEARIYSTVAHSNLVEVMDMGETDDGIPYMVMELLAGTDLARLILDQGRLGAVAAVTIALEVLRTLEVVHSKGIVHRDLKPENIFLSPSEGRIRIKILDFGISRLVLASRRDSRLTQKGIVFGTPQYMSPEQALGRDDVDHRSDLFTVGEMLYEMMTGREVFQGENNLAIISAVTAGRFTPPRQIEPDVPPEIEAVIVKALEREPANRYQTATEFMDPLLAFAHLDPRFEEGRILDVDERMILPSLGLGLTDPCLDRACTKT